jgi:hypothetical protein
LFVLDHLTGNLQVYVLNARSGQAGAVYRTNVLNDLGAEGKADAELLMVTGSFDFTAIRRTGQDRYAECICYVAEASSGRVAGYTFAFNPTLATRGELQTGAIVKIFDFRARDEGIIRQ